MKRSPLKKKSKTPVKKVIQELVKVSHDYIRRRDSFIPEVTKGKCFDCDRVDEGQQFQCGHWIPDSSGGALLRYHPDNMHGQSGSCNCKYNQEKVKVDYTLAMIRKYGNERVEELRAIKNRTIKADILFYSRLLELYKKGDEQKIIDFLEGEHL